MLADVDYFVRLPNGEIALLEIKTTNYNAKDHWWKDGEEYVPVYYETQGRHYMAVMDMDEIFYCCPVSYTHLYDLTPAEMCVLRLLVHGLSYSGSAKALYVEPSTVKYHVINMLQKTGLENKLQPAIAASEAKPVVELAEK